MRSRPEPAFLDLSRAAREPTTASLPIDPQARRIPFEYQRSPSYIRADSQIC